jgi:hypothetical protein
MTWEESWFASAWGQQSERQSRFGLLVAVSQDERSDEVRDSMYELWSLMDGRGDERRRASELQLWRVISNPNPWCDELHVHSRSWTGRQWIHLVEPLVASKTNRFALDFEVPPVCFRPLPRLAILLDEAIPLGARRELERRPQRLQSGKQLLERPPDSAQRRRTLLLELAFDSPE